MSELSKLIRNLKNQLYHYKKNYQLYKDLYHGMIPDNFIHVKSEDYMKMVEKSRKYDELIKRGITSEQLKKQLDL